MNLFWFIRYLAITFECVTPVLNAVWSTRNRLQHELDLLLIPLHLQFTEWGQPIGDQKALVDLDGDTVIRLVRSDMSQDIYISIKPRYNEISMRVSREIFGIHFEKEYGPSNIYYFRSPSATGTQIFRNRSEWVQSFIHSLVAHTLGPVFSNKPLNSGPWTRVDAVWTCTP
jgi:hypothetical protein